MGIVLGCITAVAQGTGSGPVGDQIQQRDRDLLQTCSPTLDQDRTHTRLKTCLPDSVQAAVKDMKQTRDQYQDKLRDQLKEQKACTTLDRDQLRTQLRDAVKDQALDRVQLRDRLQTLRETLPQSRPARGAGAGAGPSGCAPGRVARFSGVVYILQASRFTVAWRML